jgi:hypothetical protein
VPLLKVKMSSLAAESNVVVSPLVSATCIYPVKPSVPEQFMTRLFAKLTATIISITAPILHCWLGSVLSVGAVATIAGRVRVPTPAALVEAYRFCFPAWPTNIPPVGFPVASVAGVGNTRNRVVALFESILFDVAKPAGTKPANERIGPENVVIAILNSSHASDGVLCLHVVSRDCQKHRMIPGMRSVYNTSLGAVQIKKARRLGRAKSLGVIQLNVALNLR